MSLKSFPKDLHSSTTTATRADSAPSLGLLLCTAPPPSTVSLWLQPHLDTTPQDLHPHLDPFLSSIHTGASFVHSPFKYVTPNMAKLHPSGSAPSLTVTWKYTLPTSLSHKSNLPPCQASSSPHPTATALVLAPTTLLARPPGPGFHRAQPAWHHPHDTAHHTSRHSHPASVADPSPSHQDCSRGPLLDVY